MIDRSYPYRTATTKVFKGGGGGWGARNMNIYSNRPGFINKISITYTICLDTIDRYIESLWVVSRK